MRNSGDGIIVNNKKQILLVKRSSSTIAYPEHWCPPGGRDKGQDKDAKATVIREVKLETGLDFTPTELIQSSLVPNTGEVIKTHRYLGTWSGEIHIESDEIDGFGWFSYHETKTIKIAFDFDTTIDIVHEIGLI